MTVETRYSTFVGPIILMFFHYFLCNAPYWDEVFEISHVDMRMDINFWNLNFLNFIRLRRMKY